jgi:hypothetical protein
MSSEQNGRKPDTTEPPPPSREQTRHPSSRAASIWGAARDSLAAVRNLDALLRSSVPYSTIRDLLPELRTSAGVLRDVFVRAAEPADPSDAPDHALVAVGAYGQERAKEFDELLDGTADPDADRNELAQRTRILADELEASADLLSLLERAAAPVVTEINVVRIAHETGRMSGASGRGRVVVVRFQEEGPDCVVRGDPYLVGSLLALVTACVDVEGLGPLSLRVRCDPPHAEFVIEASTPADAGLPTIPIRVMVKIPPTEAAVRRLAERVGASLELGGGRGTVTLPEAGA